MLTARLSSRSQTSACGPGAPRLGRTVAELAFPILYISIFENTKQWSVESRWTLLDGHNRLHANRFACRRRADRPVRRHADVADPANRRRQRHRDPLATTLRGQ